MDEDVGKKAAVRLRELQAGLPYAEIDIEHTIVYENPDMRRLREASPEVELALRAGAAYVLRTGESHQSGVRVNAEGGEREYCLRHFPRKDEQGRIFGTDCMGLDITEHVRGQSASAVEHRFRQLIEDLGSDHLLYAMLPDGTISYAGPGASHFVGLPPEECVGRSVFEVMPFMPESVDTARRELRNILQGKSYAVADLEYLHPDGGRRTIAVASHPLLSATGEVLGVEGLCWDITGRKRMEESLRKREQTVRAMLDATSDLAVLYDNEGVIREVNEAYARRIGWPRESLPGRCLREVLSRERLLRRYADTREARRTRGPVRGSLLWNGHWEQYVLYPLLSDAGEADAFVFFAHDVSELKRSELELRKLHSAIEQASVAMVVVDGNGLVEFVNNQFFALTGQRREDVVGGSIAVLRSWRLDRASRRSLRNAIRNGVGWHGEIRYHRNNGTDVWADCSVSPVRRPSGEGVLHVLVAKDITERKRLELVREDAERIVRHNLKSPLSTMSNVFFLLRQSGALQGELLDYLRLGEEALRRMVRQVDMSLVLFRMEAGLYECTGESVDVAAVLRTSLASLRIRAEKEGVRVVLRIDGGEDAGQRVMIRAEHANLICMADNLLENALDASEQGHALTVEIDREAGAQHDEVVLRFRNSRPVPEAVRHCFFEKYATCGKRHGTGLGTYSARLIAESMGGSIGMRSSEEQGTCVEVRFPMAAANLSVASDRIS